MKLFCLLLTAFALALNSPAMAKDTKKDDKKDAKKGAMAEKKEYLFTATIAPTLGDPTEGDLTVVKNILMQATEFKCKSVKLEGKEIVATLANEKGRLSKSDVARPLKEEKRFKVNKVDDVKPEKEKKDDKKDEKKDDKAAPAATDKKEEMKPGDKPADPKAADPKAEPKK